jgi:hypothetical protein
MLAHLYAAGKFFNLRDPVWPDMEMVLERQGKTRLFVGDLPASFEDARKKLRLPAVRQLPILYDQGVTIT